MLCIENYYNLNTCYGLLELQPPCLYMMKFYSLDCCVLSIEDNEIFNLGQLNANETIYEGSENK